MSAPQQQNREIVNSRIFTVPRLRLFEAFSDPVQLAQWWGPKGFRNTFDEFDFRPGGMWRFTMHAPNGAEYHNTSNFTEIVTPERIVFVHLKPVHQFEMTMLFSEEDGGTRLTWHMLFETDEGEQMRGFITAANEENFDRLEAVATGAPVP